MIHISVLFICFAACLERVVSGDFYEYFNSNHAQIVLKKYFNSFIFSN